MYREIDASDEHKLNKNKNKNKNKNDCYHSMKK
jgi:hypothetical protein